MAHASHALLSIPAPSAAAPQPPANSNGGHRAAYIAHYERENEVLRGHVRQLRQLIDQRELYLKQADQALEARSREAQELAERAELARRLVQQADSAAAPSPELKPPGAADGVAPGAPATPGRRALSLQQVIPSPVLASTPLSTYPSAASLGAPPGIGAPSPWTAGSLPSAMSGPPAHPPLWPPAPVAGREAAPSTDATQAPL